MRRHRRLEIGILLAEIGQDRLILDVGISRVFEPCPPILDTDAVAFIFMGLGRGDGGRWKLGHARLCGDGCTRPQGTPRGLRVFKARRACFDVQPERSI